MRLAWTRLAGLPEPRCNLPVFDRRGHHVGTPDLIDPVAGVVGEYEGVVHLERGQRGRDVRREQAFRDVGLEYFVMLAADWRDDTAALARMHSAYRRARSGPAGPRQWTVQPPPWWKPTDTVNARRSLSRSERLRLLAYRAG